MRKIVFSAIFLIFLLGALGAENFVLAKEEINFFYSKNCPHCAEEEEFLSRLEKDLPQVEINNYEVTGSFENQRLLEDFYNEYEVPKREWGLVPVTFISDSYFLGFNDQIGERIKNYLQDYVVESSTNEIDVPFFGKVDISRLSLPVLAVLLGAVDGLNPCAMWILIFLIALLVNTRSRKRMWLIGGTFIAVSGIIYFLILSAWLNLFLAISYVNFTRIIIGTFAVIMGFWQIKNFLTYHPGVCKVVGISPKLGESLQNKAEKLVSAPLNLAIMGGIVALAFGVNLVEFFCSAGLPAIFTRVLALSELGALSYYSYILLYVLVFMLDDLIIFSLAVITLSKVGFTDKYNYWATLLGGLLILALGFLLIFRPDILMFS